MTRRYTTMTLRKMQDATIKFFNHPRSDIYRLNCLLILRSNIDKLISHLEKETAPPCKPKRYPPISD